MSDELLKLKREFLYNEAEIKILEKNIEKNRELNVKNARKINELNNEIKDLNEAIDGKKKENMYLNADKKRLEKNQDEIKGNILNELLGK